LGIPMKYIVVNRTRGQEGMAFLKSGRAGIASESNPPRLFDCASEAEKHARLVRSMLGGEWSVAESSSVVERQLVELVMA
jgi:hypothetical protein